MDFIRSIFTSKPNDVPDISDRRDSGFGSRESTMNSILTSNGNHTPNGHIPMEVDSTQQNGSLTSSMTSLNGGSRRSGIVVTAGIGTRSPLSRRRGMPDTGAGTVTRVARPGVGVEDPVSATVLRSNSGSGGDIRVIPNFSNHPVSATRGDNILGTITIGNEEPHSEQTGYGGVDVNRPCHQTGGNRGHNRPEHRPAKPVTPNPPMMTINVRSHINNNRISPFRVMTTAKVEDLMALIKKELSIPPDQQRLLFGGKQLEQGRFLQDYGLIDGSTIDLLGRLRGG